MAEKKNFRLGLTCAICAQVCWGCFPIYVDVFSEENDFALTFVAHRIVWSFVVLIGMLLVGKLTGLRSGWLIPDHTEARQNLGRPRVIGLVLLAAVFIASNWLLFVWSVVNAHKIDASLGYYLCPQVVVLLGVLLIGERLNRLQWSAMVVVSAGVAYMFVTASGKPWISVAIAFSFGFYALIKKRIQLSALVGLTLETGVLLIPAIAILIWLWNSGEPVIASSFWRNLLLVGTGVATITPLALYAAALKHITLSTMGLLQFIGPTIQFFLGTLYFGENFDVKRMIGFTICWVGVGLFLSALRKPHSTE